MIAELSTVSFQYNTIEVMGSDVIIILIGNPVRLKVVKFAQTIIRFVPMRLHLKYPLNLIEI